MIVYSNIPSNDCALFPFQLSNPLQNKVIKVSITELDFKYQILI